MGLFLTRCMASAASWMHWRRPGHSGSAGIPEGRYTLQTMLAAGTAETERRNGRHAILSHEIRNYLCTLKGNARLLRQRAQGYDQQVIIDRIDHAVEKLESFAAEMGGSPTGVAGARLLPVRLEDAAMGTVHNHFHREDGHGGGFKWDIRSGAAAILGDANRLEQVFLNLYANAREAGALNVTTFLDVRGDRVLVRVEDDGRGCDFQDLPRIFEPFFSTKEGPARRGLGMFIVQSIVENHGGTIQVRSKNHLGMGAHGLIFQLEFPRLAAEAKRLPPSASAAGGSRCWLTTLPEPF